MIPVMGLLLLGFALHHPPTRNVVVAVESPDGSTAQAALAGFEAELMQAVAHEAGFTVTFLTLPWQELFRGLDTGSHEAVIAAVIITAHRGESYDFSLPYLNAGQIIIVPRTAALPSALEDLEGKAVGFVTGSAGEYLVRRAKGLEPRPCDTLEKALGVLATGGAQALVCDRLSALDLAAANTQIGAQFQAIDNPLTEKYYGIVVKKGNQALLDGINEGLSAIRAQGIDGELERKYLRWW